MYVIPFGVLLDWIKASGKLAVGIPTSLNAVNVSMNKSNCDRI